MDVNLLYFSHYFKFILYIQNDGEENNIAIFRFNNFIFQNLFFTYVAIKKFVFYLCCYKIRETDIKFHMAYTFNLIISRITLKDYIF